MVVRKVFFWMFFLGVFSIFPKIGVSCICVFLDKISELVFFIWVFIFEDFRNWCFLFGCIFRSFQKLVFLFWCFFIFVFFKWVFGIILKHGFFLLLGSTFFGVFLVVFIWVFFSQIFKLVLLFGFFFGCFYFGCFFIFLGCFFGVVLCVFSKN